MGVIADLVYRITADPDVTPGLVAAERETRLAMERMDRMKAEAELRLDTHRFETAALSAEQQLKRLDKELIGWNEALERGAVSQDEYTTAVVNNENAQEHLERQMRDNRFEAKKSRTALQQLTQASRSHTDQVEREHLEVQKLGRRYAELYTASRKLEKLDRGRRTARETLLLRQNAAEMDLVRKRLSLLGHDFKQFEQDLRGNRSLGRWLRDLGQVRIHMGFFSASIRQAAVGAAALAPILSSIIGTASALIGVLGTGLAGALSVSGAAVLGFGLTFGGLFAAIHGHTQELKKDWQELGKSFQGKTGATRQNFAAALASGMKTANALLPTFAANTNKASGALLQGWNKWMEGLRSGEAKKILDDVMGNFTKSIPSLMDGLGTIGTILGRIGQSASKFLPSLSGGFAKWADQLAEAVGSGKELDTRMGRLVTHMRDVGHFAQSGGRLLMAFFSAGADTGDSMLKSMTKTMNAWTKAIKGGSLDEFFKNSAEVMDNLAPMLGHIIKMFFTLSEVGQPLAEGVLWGLQQILAVFSALPAPVLQAIGLFIALRKAMSFLMGAQLLGMLGKGLLGGGLARLIPALAGGATAAKGAQLAFAGMGAETAVLGAGLGSLLLPLGAATAGGLALGGAIVLLTKGIKDTIPLHTRLADAMDNLVKADREENAAIAAQNKSRRNLTKTLKDQHATAEELANATQQSLKADQRATKAEHERESAMKTAKATMQEYKNLRQNLNSFEAKGLQNARGGAGIYAAMRAELARVAPVANLASINFKRMAADMAALGPKAARTFAQLRKNVGSKLTTKVGLSGSRQVVTQTAQISNRLSKLGLKPQVIKILANADNARQALRKLGQLASVTTKPKRMSVILASNAVNSIKNALTGINTVGKQVEKPKKVKVTEQGSVPSRNNVQQLKSAIDSVHDKSVTVTVTTVYKQVGHPGARAEGGVFHSAASGKTIDRAAERAQNAKVRTSDRGAEVRRPTLLTGEENRREWVIAENPAYRLSNEAYLHAAAEAFGYAMIPAMPGGGAKGKGKHRTRPPRKKHRKVATSHAMDRYNALHYDLLNWQDEYALDRRDYDRGVFTGGGSYGSQFPGDQAGVFASSGKEALLLDLQKQIDDYNALIPVIKKIQGEKPHEWTKKERAKLAAIKQYIKRLEKKKHKSDDDKAKLKHARQIERSYEAAKRGKESYNADLRSDQGPLAQELREIPYLIRGLEIDMDELNHPENSSGGGTDLTLPQQDYVASQARQELLRSYGSNIIGAMVNGQPGGMGNFGLSVGSQAYNPLGTLSQLPPQFGSGGFPSNPGVLSPGGAVVYNYFAAPPPDPHTWSQQQQFELEAM